MFPEAELRTIIRLPKPNLRARLKRIAEVLAAESSASLKRDGADAWRINGCRVALDGHELKGFIANRFDELLAFHSQHLHAVDDGVWGGLVQHAQAQWHAVPMNGRMFAVPRGIALSTTVDTLVALASCSTTEVVPVPPIFLTGTQRKHVQPFLAEAARSAFASFKAALARIEKLATMGAEDAVTEAWVELAKTRQLLAVLVAWGVRGEALVMAESYAGRFELMAKPHG